MANMSNAFGNIAFESTSLDHDRDFQRHDDPDRSVRNLTWYKASNALRYGTDRNKSLTNQRRCNHCLT